MKRIVTLSLLALAASAALSKIPTPVLTDEAKAKAAEAAAKTAHGGKVANFQLCKSMDRSAARYYAEAVKYNAAAGIATPPPSPAAPKKESSTKSISSKPAAIRAVTVMPKADSNRQEFCFFSPANFPRREYGQKGENVDAGGLVIFEGMTLSTDAKGRYDLSFHTNTPDVPVTLRLQLLVKLEHDCAWHTITLAPIHIPGRNELKDDAKGQELQHHVRTGDIAAMRGLTCGSKILEIRREGSARFGYDRADVQYSLAAE